MSTASRLRVLLTNDDGPPGHNSPYIYGLYRHLTKELGWDVKVVIPSSQKSWIGKAYHITETIYGRYYYPRDSEDGAGEVSETSRPLKDGETAEWVLLDGTPATCANIGLHNLYPGEIDLVISGPNLGRNSSSAFALSSGTIGAALSSSLSKIRSIAISYGTVVHPTPTDWFEPAHVIGGRIIRHLWNNWGIDEGGIRNNEVDLYNVNIPMISGLLEDPGLPIAWTRIWRNSYGRLFKREEGVKPASSPAGPDSLDSNPQGMLDTALLEGANIASELTFKFAPAMEGLIRPDAANVPVGSDGWAILKGWISVTPLRASFAEPRQALENAATGPADIDKSIWKVKL
ncbi:survival protein sure-like phosphatase/nucleotidase [Irpex rosettiformis]|uniref:Survival protein sure-like phosphatase/nucleotidase n=1 Tax=Irpex rosettiformis TaxID=378272 RepID=A0ACB8UL31_9APHY|nr:survival protein sure-like phosphatase/nucleotidase [Irpex rosettiformis]